MDGYSFESDHYAVGYYERDRLHHLNPKSALYGSKLVKMKRQKSGICIQWRFYWRNHFYSKPVFRWKSYAKYFHWLWFMVWVEYQYVDVIDHIEKDHLKEWIESGEPLPGKVITVTAKTSQGSVICKTDTVEGVIDAVVRNFGFVDPKALRLAAKDGVINLRTGNLDKYFQEGDEINVHELGGRV